MSEIRLSHELVGGKHTYESPFSDRLVRVTIAPSVERGILPAPPGALCDRVKIYVAGDRGTLDGYSASIEVPVTQPPRTPEQFGELASRLAAISVAAAHESFAAYRQ